MCSSADFAALSVIEIVTVSLEVGKAGDRPANATNTGLPEVFRTEIVALTFGVGKSARTE